MMLGALFLLIFLAIEAPSCQCVRSNFIPEVIALCEKLAGQDANMTTVLVSVHDLLGSSPVFSHWTNDDADRLAFSEALSSDTVFSVPMAETYNVLGVDQKDIVDTRKVSARLLH